MAALRGSDLIVHAGDIGSPEILDELRTAAPTFAVRGNVDRGAWAESLPATAVVEAEGTGSTCCTSSRTSTFDPGAAGFSAVISGHTHQQVAGTRRGVLYLNPGSAGPRGFRLPVTLARLRVTEAGLEPETVELRVDGWAARPGGTTATAARAAARSASPVEAGVSRTT